MFFFSFDDIFHYSLLKSNIIGKERRKKNDLRSGQIYLEKAACNVDSSHHHLPVYFFVFDYNSN